LFAYMKLKNKHLRHNQLRIGNMCFKMYTLDVM